MRSKDETSNLDVDIVDLDLVLDLFKKNLSYVIILGPESSVFLRLNSAS